MVVVTKKHSHLLNCVFNLSYVQANIKLNRLKKINYQKLQEKLALEKFEIVKPLTVTDHASKAYCIIAIN